MSHGLRQEFKNDRPDLATNQLQILASTSFNGLLCQKGNLHFSHVLERWFVRKIFDYYT